MRLIATGLPALLLISCTSDGPTAIGRTAPADQAVMVDLSEQYRPCGAAAARRIRPDGTFPNIGIGDTVRPCEPIGAEAIAHACRIEAGEVVYDPERPNDDAYASFVGPELTARDVSCRPTREDGGEVECDFTIANDGVAHRVSGHAFSHVYSEYHDEISHSYWAYWSTRQSCLAPARDG